MDDGLDAVQHQSVVEPLRLRQVRDDQPLGRHGGAVAHRQIVVDPNVVAARQEEFHGMAADVARAAGH